MVNSLTSLCFCSLTSKDLSIFREYFPNGLNLKKISNIPIQSFEHSKLAIISTTVLKEPNNEESGVRYHSVCYALKSSIIMKFFNNKSKKYRIKVFYMPEEYDNYLEMAYRYQHFSPFDIYDDIGIDVALSYYKFYTTNGFFLNNVII